MKRNTLKQLVCKLLFLTLGLIGLQACKKYPEPPIFNEELVETKSVSRKVIVISIDGVTGAELKTIAPPTISSLLPTSKYSFATFRSAVATDAATWASMLMGVSYTKHQISMDDFQPAGDGSGMHEGVTLRRNVLDLITSASGMKTALVTPWDNLREFAKVADYTPVVSNDLAAKDSTIHLLNKFTNIASTVVNFREVATAGAKGGYLASNATYKEAVLKADGYVKEILDAIKARKTYADEDWLVIVTTNHGGSSESPEKGFLVVSNPNFKQLELVKSGFNTIQLTGLAKAIVPNDNGLYDVGDKKDMTIQVQVRFPQGKNFPGFLGKTTNGAPSDKTLTGWAWLLNGSNYYAVAGGTANGGTGREANYFGGEAVTGSWRTLTMTIKTKVNNADVVTERVLKLYSDGVLKTTQNILPKKSLATAGPLTLGYNIIDGGYGGVPSFNASNLTYFNVALSDEEILQNLNLKDIKQHPRYTNLTGYWKIDEAAEGSIINHAPNGYNMELTGAYSWVNLGNDAPSQSIFEPPTGGYSYLPSSGDIGALMMYWTKTKIEPEFDINGYPFLKDFEIEFLK